MTSKESHVNRDCLIRYKFVKLLYTDYIFLIALVMKLLLTIVESYFKSTLLLWNWTEASLIKMSRYAFVP